MAPFKNRRSKPVTTPPSSPPAPKTEVHLKPVWNGLDEPIWIIAAARYSPISKIVEKSPSNTRVWRDAWGWEIDHSEYKDLTTRLLVEYDLCPQCLAGGPGTECDGVSWKLFKIGVRARLATEKRAPKDQRYQYKESSRKRSSFFHEAFFGHESSGAATWDSEELSDDELAAAAGVLGLPWPLDRATAPEEIKKAFGKAALAAHSDRDAMTKSDEEKKLNDEMMKKVLDARTILTTWIEG